MACSLKQTCVIEDVVAVQKYLFEEENGAEEEDKDDDEIAWKEDNWVSDWGDEENDKEKAGTDSIKELQSNWLRKCQLAFSPTYDLLAVAHGDKLVILSARSDTLSRHRADGPRKYKVSNQFGICDEPGEYVTSLLCIPLVSLKKTSHGSVDWSCIVVGLSSGYIRMYTETGDQLISQLLHESSVVEIRCRTHDPMVMRRSVSVVDQPDEVTILYRDAVILLEGFSLFQTLRACRSQVALAAASGGSSIDPPPLSYKKWTLVGGQTTISSHVSPGVLTMNPFDQMRTASILGGVQAEIRGSAPANSCFVATGSAPFAGFYYAVEGSAQPHLSHVAFAVASKLKSALYSSATRWLAWGAGMQQEAEQKPKVELGSPLDIRCGMPDPLRHGNGIVLAPGAHLSVSALAATTDSLGRVILMDLSRAIALRMWKGYRDAQVGFMRVFDDAHRTHKHHHHHHEIGGSRSMCRHALFLIIYAPRRGLLEVWTCVNGPRVGAFNVSKNARLLCPGHGMMGLSTGTMTGTTSRAFQCCLLEANGQVREIRIPFHLALSDANSKKARDMHLLKKLNLILHSKRKTGEEAATILLEIRISGMLRQALEKLLHARNIGAETFRNCINAIQQRLREGGALKKPDNDLLKYCESQIDLIDCYEAVRKLNESGNSESDGKQSSAGEVENVETMCSTLHMTRTEAADALSAVARFQESQHTPRVKFDGGGEKPTMDVAEFLDCFLVGGAMSPKDAENEWRPELSVSEDAKSAKLAAFLFHSCLFADSLPEDVLFTIDGALDLEPRIILNLVFKHWLAQDTVITENLANCLTKLYAFVETSYKKSASTPASPISDPPEEDCVAESCALWEWIREDVCATSSNAIAAYFLAIVCRAIAIASNALDNKEEKEDSDESWEKMQIQEAEEEEKSPPTYEESCSGEASKSRSGDWETLWIDVEKWNLFVHQLEDSLLINTAANLGCTRTNTSVAMDEEKETVEEDKPLRGEDNPGSEKNISVKDLLSNGPGYMAELVSHSICQLNILPHCVEKPTESGVCSSANDKQQAFLDFLHQTLFSKFPYSLAPDCLHSHCFWELMVEWNKEPLEMTRLSNAIEHLKLVRTDAHARHGLALMAWRTFVAKRYAALAKLVEKVGKAPKDRLCRKEVGISDTLMPSFCQSCTDILQIIADANFDAGPRPADHNSDTLVCGAEDPWQNVTGKRSIMDMGRAQSQANTRLVQHNMYLSFILHGTMQFMLRGVKPLSALFSQRGKSCFAHDLTVKDPALPNPDMTEPEVSRARQHFLMKVISAAVQRQALLVLKPDGAELPSSGASKKELGEWIETAIHVAAALRLSADKIKIYHANELFKNGLDAIGQEACTTVGDKEVLSSSLALIVGQRLSYILFHSNADVSATMMSRMSPTVSTWIRSQDSSVLKLPDAPISDTLNLARTVLMMMTESNSLYNMVVSLEEVASNMASD